MNKWKIYFLLFGFALCCGLFGILSKNAFAVESYKISPAQDRDFKRNYYQSMYLDQSKNINMHYYFYAPDKYSRKIKLISYICENQYDNYKELPDCGLYMLQEAGSFKIKLKATGYTFSDYNRETQESDYAYVNHSYDNTQFVEVASYTDEDFKKGLTLLGGTTLKTNTWNLNEGGFLLDPVGGNSNNSGNNGNNNSNNGGGFDILGGIKAFFQPMIDSIARTQKVVLGIADNIISGIAGVFKGAFDILKNIWDFLGGILSKIAEFVKNAFLWAFVPSQEDLNTELAYIQSMFKFDKITNVLNTTYLPLDSAGFRYDSQCSDGYWDSTSPHLNDLFNAGGQKYAKGFRLITSICKVPKIYITLARNLLMFAFFWWSAYRLFQLVPIVMGSAYVWDRWFKKEG